MPSSLKDRFYEFTIDVDADGTSRRLIVRIFTALLLAFGLFKLLPIPDSYIIWLLLGAINNMLALGHAPKKNLFYYYLLSVFVLSGFIILGSYFDIYYKYFIVTVGAVAFLTGLLGIFGITGKLIGALGFVLFAISSSVGISVHNDLYHFALTYGIVAFSVFIVMFVAIPIPREKIIEGAKRKYYKLLKEILLGHANFDAIKTREMLLGIKEGLCDKLPLECDRIVQKFIRFRNSIFMLQTYKNNNNYENKEILQVTKLMDELSLATAFVFSALIHQKDTKRRYGLFASKKQEIERHIQHIRQEKRDAFSQKEMIHLAVASHIINEIDALLVSEVKA